MYTDHPHHILLAHPYYVYMYIYIHIYFCVYIYTDYPRHTLLAYSRAIPIDMNPEPLTFLGLAQTRVQACYPYLRRVLG